MQVRSYKYPLFSSLLKNRLVFGIASIELLSNSILLSWCALFADLHLAINHPCLSQLTLMTTKFMVELVRLYLRPLQHRNVYVYVPSVDSLETQGKHILGHSTIVRCILEWFFFYLKSPVLPVSITVKLPVALYTNHGSNKSTPSPLFKMPIVGTKSGF